MTTNTFPSRTLGWLAIAIGGVTLIGVVSLILYFTVGSLFGMFSDSLRTVGVRPRPCDPGQQTCRGRDPDAEVLGLGGT